ncbi:uncharacterized protein LOC141653438 [Silene latifolia]|uniref:uncharacterized protein LOC141653437 n=1 Tax=Silene latifolia TaxID=37657 RepID=UPI003D782C19
MPQGIVEKESDFYFRRLWGEPSEDVTKIPKYLVTFTVGYELRNNIDAAVKKFSDNFIILLFHYDGRTCKWEDFEWSKRAINVSTRQVDWTFCVILGMGRLACPPLVLVIVVAPLLRFFHYEDNLKESYFIKTSNYLVEVPLDISIGM